MAKERKKIQFFIESQVLFSDPSKEEIDPTAETDRLPEEDDTLLSAEEIDAILKTDEEDDPLAEEDNLLKDEEDTPPTTETSDLSSTETDAVKTDESDDSVDEKDEPVAEAEVDEEDEPIAEAEVDEEDEPMAKETDSLDEEDDLLTKETDPLAEDDALLSDEDDGTNGLIEAVVTTWGPREGADGRRFNYNPEGFMDWLKEFEAMDKPLPMYFQHDEESLPVGQWTKFEMDDVGLKAEGKLFLNTSAGKDLYTIMKESPNLVGGVSVGAYADEYQMVDAEGNVMDESDDEDGYFQIGKGGIKEVSIVMDPNNLESMVTKLEYFRKDGSADLKVIEKVLRDAKLSRKDATTASSILKQILELRDATKVVKKKTLIQSEADAVVNERKLLAALEERDLLKILNNRIKG